MSKVAGDRTRSDEPAGGDPNRLDAAAQHERTSLDVSRVPTSAATGLDGAIAGWAEEATRLLEEHYRPGSWAMQSIAGTIALLSQVTMAAVDEHRRDGRLPEAAARTVSSALAGSVTCWRAAASWPPHLRLGGQSRELRILANELRDECLAGPVPRLSDLHHGLALFEPVAGLHAIVMERLVTQHEIWIHGSALGVPGGQVEGWVREPWWSTQGLFLLRASRADSMPWAPLSRISRELSRR